MAELRSDSHRSTETTVARIAKADEGGTGTGIGELHEMRIDHQVVVFDARISPPRAASGPGCSKERWMPKTTGTW